MTDHDIKFVKQQLRVKGLKFKCAYLGLDKHYFVIGVDEQKNNVKFIVRWNYIGYPGMPVLEQYDDDRIIDHVCTVVAGVGKVW